VGTVTEVTETTYAEAIRQALHDAMAEDVTIVLLGQDVAVGFPWGITRGLVDVYGPERVRDTPISEAATMGCGVGAAIRGLRPVVEVDFSGFLYLGLDQLVNNAAKLRYMSGGQVRIPLVVRVGQGALGSFAAQHSQAQHAMLANVPGLALCAPSTPQDAYELMRWSLRQMDPVVFAEDMRMYRMRGPLDPRNGGSRPGAAIRRAGRDASVLTFGFGVHLATEGAEELAGEGIEVEVVDLRTISPLDTETIGESARRTGRVLCLADDPLLGGITATLAAAANEQAYEALRAPVLRIGARHTPAPYAPSLERLVFPSKDTLANAVRELVAWG
jgi:pyruvate/2-oxoglutarate/acetoin dehydrogenase E1 component